MNVANWTYNDGGRAQAGYKGHTTDCVVRAIAIATQKPYQEVYDVMNLLGKQERRSKFRASRSSARSGVYKETYAKYLRQLGWQWVPTMQIGSGCKVHLKKEELPGGRLLVACSKHLVAVIDGQIHDIGDPSRRGTRCVYGYWKEPAI